MTPDDVAAIRASLPVTDGPSAKRTRRLCDALKSAWAERDAAWAERDAADEGAEQAQIERDEAKAELTVLYGELSALITRAERAEAALARVRALCCEPACEWAGCVCHVLRAALEGTDQ